MTKQANADDAKTVKTQKSVTLATTISAEFNEQIENVRWNLRLNKSEVLKDALKDWATKHGIDVKP